MMKTHKMLMRSCTMLSKGLNHTASVALRFANWSQTKSDYLKWFVAQQQTNSEPNLSQWANRLIEYCDSDIIVDVYKRFEALVRVGLTPEHAFRLVVSL